MRMVIQRVGSAEVAVNDAVVGSIGPGLLVFLGVGRDDAAGDIDWLVERLVKLRLFESAPGRMDRSLLDTGGGALVISQFTLYGSLKKGNRPSFNRAAAPESARALYERFVHCLSTRLGRDVATGRFAAHMNITAENDGPVTLVVDSRERDF